jgi:hypothetical protein
MITAPIRQETQVTALLAASSLQRLQPNNATVFTR